MKRYGKAVPFLILPLLLGPLEKVFAGDEVVVDRREKGYRLRASSDWKAQQTPGGIDSAIRMTSPPCSLTVVLRPASDRDEITEFDLKTAYGNSEQEYASRTFVKQKLETHRGKPSGWYEFTGELKQAPGVLLHFRQYITLHRNQLYVITVWTQEDFWRKAERQWQSVIRSMEFL